MNNDTLNGIPVISNEYYGECMGWSCPICDEISEKIGDLRNQFVIVYGEKMCNDCKDKLRKLINK
jgi:hypothetical protein